MTKTFILSWPPSVNNLFVNVKGRGRVPSKRYQQWIAGASIDLLAQRVRRVPGPVSISLEFGAPDRRKRDLDNLCKGPIDALVANGVIDGDDSTVVRSILMKWTDALKGVRVTVAQESGE